MDCVDFCVLTWGDPPSYQCKMNVRDPLLNVRDPLLNVRDPLGNHTQSSLHLLSKRSSERNGGQVPP